jgi:hypothetical protein
VGKYRIGLAIARYCGESLGGVISKVWLRHSHRHRDKTCPQAADKRGHKLGPGVEHQYDTRTRRSEVSQVPRHHLRAAQQFCPAPVPLVPTTIGQKA